MSPSLSIAFLFFGWLQPESLRSSRTLFFLSHPIANPSANLAASTNQPDLTLLATYMDSNPGPTYHHPSVLPGSSLAPFGIFSTEHHNDLVNMWGWSCLCSEASESSPSHSVWRLHSFKWTTKPPKSRHSYLWTQLLSLLYPYLHPLTFYSGSSAPSSLPGVFSPDFYPAHFLLIPCKSLFKCHLFQAIILTTTHTHTPLFLCLALFFFSAVWLHRQPRSPRTFSYSSE